MLGHSQAISLSIVSILLLMVMSSNACGITIYWGQNGNEGPLTAACDTDNYKYVAVAFLINFGSGQDPLLNLASHCDPSSDGCTGLSTEIRHCQSLGIQVLLSLGGSAGRYNISSPEDATQVANYLWNAFLGGTDPATFRPLGDAALDGIDFDIEYPLSPLYWDELARALLEYSTPQRKIYLSAAPECPTSVLESPIYNAAIRDGLFDYVWVQFYNNPYCSYATGVPNLVASWNEWSSYLPANTQLFLGLPASPDAAGSGYIPANVLINEVLPQIRNSPNYGGVMLWSRFYDLLSNYSSAIYPYVCSSSLNREELLISQVV